MEIVPGQHAAGSFNVIKAVLSQFYRFFRRRMVVNSGNSLIFSDKFFNDLFFISKINQVNYFIFQAGWRRIFMLDADIIGFMAEYFPSRPGAAEAVRTAAVMENNYIFSGFLLHI